MRIGGPLCHRAVVGSLLITAVSGKNRPARAVNSSSYRGGFGGRYIKRGLSGSLGRKGLYTRV